MDVRPGAGCAPAGPVIITPVSEFASALHKQEVDPDPVRQFAAWFGDATAARVPAPEAMAVATASIDAQPSVRMVLMKHFDERGFVFYTNYESRKARELEANPRAALLFYWELLGRQVRIEGAAERTTLEETAEYVRTRPRESQLSALASPQSQVIGSREVLERRMVEIAARYEGSELPLPEAWGGFRVRPDSFEFWQRRPGRFHDRLRYRRDDDARWVVQRLAP